jgi:alanine racemase
MDKDALRTALLRTVWAEVDLDAVAHNVRRIIEFTGPSVRLYAALKGDGYGHGCVEVARAVVDAGGHGLAFANLYECIQIREAGVAAPILLYAGTPPYLAETIVRYGITPTVTDFQAAAELSPRVPDGFGVFFKVDTGLDRAGVYAEDALAAIQAIAQLPNIRLEGVYTHFHSGSGSDEYARWQFARFAHFVKQLDETGLRVPVRLAASSPFIAMHPEMHLNAIDPGQLIFGLPVGLEAQGTLDLVPALQAVKTCIVQIREPMERGQFVEEALFDAARAKRFGLLPLGWGDGLHAGYGNGGPALVGGKRTTVLGPVHYEHSRVDLTSHPDARVGDEVVLMGCQGAERIGIDEVARHCGLQVPQVVGTLSKYMPVVYFRHGVPTSVTMPAHTTEPVEA